MFEGNHYKSKLLILNIFWKEKRYLSHPEIAIQGDNVVIELGEKHQQSPESPLWLPHITTGATRERNKRTWNFFNFNYNQIPFCFVSSLLKQRSWYPSINSALSLLWQSGVLHRRCMQQFSQIGNPQLQEIIPMQKGLELYNLIGWNTVLPKNWHNERSQQVGGFQMPMMVRRL